MDARFWFMAATCRVLEGKRGIREAYDEMSRPRPAVDRSKHLVACTSWSFSHEGSSVPV